MIYLLLILCLLAITGLLLKLHLLRKSLREVGDSLEFVLSQDTNLLITVSSRDKTVRRLAELFNTQLRLLRKEKQRYEHGDRELKEAVTNISHDLRTPLTALCGYLELLKKEEHSSSAQRYLEIMEGRIASMRLLTEELLQYSLVRSLRLAEPTSLSLNAILEDSIISFYAALEARHITPVISIPDSPVMRFLDASSLNRIFQNIIGNAVKYSQGDLSVTLTENGTITFVNSAPGLTPVTTAKLFDRFYTVKTVEASQGTDTSSGLGLSIARLLAERMGGTISAEHINGELHITVQFP